jgi:salicylate hydroxylase
MSERVVIVGGGIGGLTLAIALRQRGDRGAGLRGRAGAARGRRGDLGAAERDAGAGAARRSRRPSCATGARLERAELRDFRAGVLQSADMGEAARRFGYPTVAIHRGGCQRVLLDAPRGRGARRQGVPRGRRGDGGRGRALRGRERGGGGVVVGADGAHSRVREAVAPGDAAALLGPELLPRGDAVPAAGRLRGRGMGGVGTGAGGSASPPSATGRSTGTPRSTRPPGSGSVARGDPGGA